MEQKIYNLNEYRNNKAESQSTILQDTYLPDEYEPQSEETQPIHRIKLFGHRYIVKQQAYEIYQVIGEVLTMLFGVASMGMILFYMLLIAQK